MATARPLNILACDGGGIRGLSSLMILRTLMRQLQTRLRLDSEPLPCEIFDVICGTSTGGLIAIMIGRLRMSVEDAITHYRQLSERVFGDPKSFALIRKVFGSAMYDATILERCIKKIVAEFDIRKDPDALFVDTPPEGPGTGSCCHTFVVAIAQSIADAPPVLLRSYPKRGNASEANADIYKIWEVTRATTATNMFFDAAKIGTPPNIFLDGGFVANNPSALACDEVRDLFPGQPIGCFLSLGTGVPHVVEVKGNLINIANICVKLARDCENVADEVGKKFRRESEQNGRVNPFVRFSVNRGLESVEFDEWDKEEKLRGITDGYMRYNAQEEKVVRCVGLLEGRAREIRDKEIL